MGNIKVSFINLTEENKKLVEQLLVDLILMAREYKEKANKSN